MDEYLPRSNSCPLCRHHITPNSLLELPPDASEWKEPDEHAAPIQSAKIAELIKYLKVFDGNDKSLVFSQFTSFLDHVAASLKQEGIQYCRFDGSMNPKQVSLFVDIWDEADWVETASDCPVSNSGKRQESDTEPGGDAHLAQIRGCRSESHGCELRLSRKSTFLQNMV
jgi:hypothetical protein